MFEKIEVYRLKKKKSVHIAEKILELIKSGELKAGDKLPSEREIAKQLGVSRPPVREAISALELTGMVKSISGDGTYVQEPVKEDFGRSQTLSILEESESPFEALRVRRAYEASNVEIAIEKATDEDISRLEEILWEMAEAVDTRDLDKYFSVNSDFHLAIAAATHNSLMEKILGYLLDITNQKLWKEAVQKYFADHEHVGEYLKRHQKMLSAIKDKDKELAKEEIRRHFDETVEEVKKYL